MHLNLYAHTTAGILTHATKKAGGGVAASTCTKKEWDECRFKRGDRNTRTANNAGNSAAASIANAGASAGRHAHEHDAQLGWEPHEMMSCRTHAHARTCTAKLETVDRFQQ